MQQLDTALATLEAQPTVHHFDQVRQRHQQWVGVHTNPVTGVAHSRRANSANRLAAQITAHRGVLAHAATLRQRIETLLAAENWATKCLCAELYVPGPQWNASPAAPYVQLLEEECISSSGWAKVQPNSLADFSRHGASDLDTLQQWPNLAFKSRIILQSRYGFQNWPPWGALSVRKGLFCHSSAAIAAHLIEQNRAALHAGLNCPIRSIDLVHQQPAVPGGISHWWVAVNRPDEVRLGQRVVRFDSVGDFFILPLVGGFVVDMWGALWVQQGGHEAAWATSNAVCPGAAVRDTPFISLGDNLATEAVRVPVHHVY